MRHVVFVFFVASLLLACSSSSQQTSESTVAHEAPEATSSQCTLSSDGTSVNGCIEGQLCDFMINDGACGESGQVGVCLPIPTECTNVDNTVCGCDGKSYGNLCIAHAYGVPVRYRGVCGEPLAGAKVIDPQAEGAAAVTGCNPNDKNACIEGEFCKLEPEDACGEAVGALGKCTAIAKHCTKELKPVCGCDGKSYGNACVASAYGVSVRNHGSCAVK